MLCVGILCSSSVRHLCPYNAAEVGAQLGPVPAAGTGAVGE